MFLLWASEFKEDMLVRALPPAPRPSTRYPGGSLMAILDGFLPDDLRDVIMMGAEADPEAIKTAIRDGKRVVVWRSDL